MRWSGFTYRNCLGQEVQVMAPEGGSSYNTIVNVFPPLVTSVPAGVSVPVSNVWPNQMKPGKTYHLLSRQTTTGGFTYESWYDEGGNTGDVVHIVIEPEWMKPQTNGVGDQLQSP